MARASRMPRACLARASILDREGLKQPKDGEAAEEVFKGAVEGLYHRGIPEHTVKYIVPAHYCGLPYKTVF
jgi:hypothetical protein